MLHFFDYLGGSEQWRDKKRLLEAILQKNQVDDWTDILKYVEF